MPSNELANRYAQAIFSLAEEYRLQRQITDELNGLDRLLQEHQNLRECLFNPFISAERKQAVIMDLFSLVLSPLTRDFLRLLTDKRREALLADITRRINELLRESLGIIQVRLTSALPLSPPQEAAIGQRLSLIFNRKVELDTAVDASLLGGIVIRIGHRLIDGSCRGQLEKIRYELSKN